MIKEHVETITSGSHSFVINVGGTMDPENLEILIENAGDQRVLNPRVTVNGRYNWYTLDDLVAEIVDGCETDEEKAMAIFAFVERETYWWTYPQDRTRLNPVRHFNVYGYHVCSDAACEFVALCRAAGLEARVWEIWHHTVAEVMWDGEWHHVDPDLGVWFLRDDNRTIASVAELEKNPEWVARTRKPYRWVIPAGERRKRIYMPGEDRSEKLAGLYETDEDNYVETGYDEWIYEDHDMNLTLRPHEKLVRWWTPVLRKYFDQQSTHEPPLYANGQLVFSPDFSRYSYDDDIRVRNIALEVADGRAPQVHVAQPQDARYDRPSSLRIPMRSPYVIVGGHIDTTYYKGGTGALDGVALSVDLDPTFHRQKALWRYYGWAHGQGHSRAVFDSWVLKDGPQGTYELEAEYSISASAETIDRPHQYPLVYGGQSGLDRVEIVADLQVNPRSLPALSLGRNEIGYRDESGDAREVRVTYRWREVHDEHPPNPPVLDAPEDRAETGSAPHLEWAPAHHPDGVEIACYRVQVSLRPDCAWPVCTNLDDDVRTGTGFQVPSGWLNPGTTYYWRVKAEDEQGVWSEWSSIASFTTRQARE